MRYGKSFNEEAITILFNGRTENGNSLSYNKFLDHLEQQKEQGSRPFYFAFLLACLLVCFLFCFVTFVSRYHASLL